MIPKDHPRYESLITREKITEGVEKGITGINGLIAQGRGEAFDYLLGETTSDTAMQAEKTAAAMLLLAEKPVISVNGNVAALVPGEIIELGNIVNAQLEVNIFYRTEERAMKITQHLLAHGAARICTKRDAAIPGLNHERGKVDSEGIFSADVVLVPLEDGDRCKALVEMGKNVIAIDLNPLSRTARSATVTIVDNITRAIPGISKFAHVLKDSKKDELRRIIQEFDNKKNLAESIERITAHLALLARPPHQEQQFLK